MCQGAVEGCRAAQPRDIGWSRAGRRVKTVYTTSRSRASTRFPLAVEGSSCDPHLVSKLRIRS